MLQVSEARQSTEVDVQEDSDLMRVGFGLAGIIALAVGGLGLWKGYSQRA